MSETDPVDDDDDDEMDQDDEDRDPEIEYDCGAASSDNDIKSWQGCELAGTKYCNFECPFSRMVREQLRQQEKQK